MTAFRSILYAISSPILVLKDYPILFRFKDVYIVTGGFINSVAAVLSFLVASYFYLTMFPAQTADGSWLWKLVGVVFFSLVFSKVFHFFALGREFLRNPRKYMAETAFYNQGGQIGVFLGTVWFAWSTGIDFLACMDINLTAGCLSLALGRIGCYSYGCCHGRQTTSRYATVYTHPLTKALRVFPELVNVPLVPTQLISAGYAFGLFLLMIWGLSLSPRAGIVSGVFILAYNLFRIFIERYRLSVVNVSAKTVHMKFYMGVAALILTFGLGYLAFVLWDEAPILTFAAPLTIGGFLMADVFQIQNLIAMAIIFVSYLYFWGTHYKKLGQHFEWKDEPA
ncbi:prolipoprotein diacylglyceryl transferase family protein [Bauldia litoralis]|uniref:Prolipoprotein diacylglyceryl transferase n=1 Tax=Bauldia litoralis TaxID=665467 RepID=A0A1G6A342_9HYPH|nr:prolipoprotein diacylglyceryl transferase family protein [Bauldia litoralis]SDB02413.1 Prolipoprotein diacylglyceryl transferase [Bauldia litoralis]